MRKKAWRPSLIPFTGDNGMLLQIYKEEMTDVILRNAEHGAGVRGDGWTDAGSAQRRRPILWLLPI